MEIQSFSRRFIQPAGMALFTMLVSIITYNLSRKISSISLHHLIATISGTGYFVSVAIAPVFVYIISCLRGATMKERVLAVSITPFIWATKESMRLYESHTLLECFYWYLSPLNIWLATLIGIETGLGNIFCRYRFKKRGSTIRVINVSSLLTIFVSLFLGVSIYAWGKGENFYVMFLEGYRYFFGTGLSAVIN